MAGFSNGKTRLEDPQVLIDDIVMMLEFADPQPYNDGEAEMSTLGNLIVIRHTVAGHDRAANFLNELRAAQGIDRTVKINAWWVFGKRAELERVLAGFEHSRDALSQLPADQVFHQMVSVNEGMTTHIIAGNLRSGIESVIPVVGQNGLPAGSDTVQFANATTPDSPSAKSLFSDKLHYTGSSSTALQFQEPATGISPRSAYQPVVESLLFGSLLEISASHQSSGRGYSVDFRNVVVMPGATDPMPSFPFLGGMILQGKNLVAQQFSSRTVLAAPGKCSIVGGGALQSGKPELGECWLVLMVE